MKSGFNEILNGALRKERLKIIHKLKTSFELHHGCKLGTDKSDKKRR